MSTPADRLANRIFLGMLIGVAAGALLRVLFPHVAGLQNFAQQTATQVLDPLGRVFLRMLFMVVVPLVFASLTLGVVQLGRLDRLGPLAGRTFALFALNMAIGVALGLVMMNLVKPGKRLDPATQEKIQVQFQVEAKKQEVRSAEVTAGPTQRPLGWLVDTFLPANMLRSVVGDSPARIGDVLPLILFAIFLGAAGTTLPEAQRISLQQSLELLSGLMTRIVGWALQLAPFAVAAMLMSTIINLGLQFLVPLLWFTISVLVVMAIHCFGTMSLLLRLMSSRSPLAFFKAIRTILFTAFSTSSSNATLPTTIQVSRDRLNVSAPVAGFVLPLGATMNMSGTALYEGCVVLFIAQVYGVDLSLAQQTVLLLLAVLSAVAVAGIPGASLPLIIGLLANFNIPPEGLGLILGVDRLLDMARTTLNVAADVVTAVIVDEQEQRQV